MLTGPARMRALDTECRDALIFARQRERRGALPWPLREQLCSLLETTSRTSCGMLGGSEADARETCAHIHALSDYVATVSETPRPRQRGEAARTALRYAIDQLQPGSSLVARVPQAIGDLEGRRDVLPRWKLGVERTFTRNLEGHLLVGDMLVTGWTAWGHDDDPLIGPNAAMGAMALAGRLDQRSNDYQLDAALDAVV